MTPRTPLYVFGAGGHGKEVVASASKGPSYDVVGVLDGDPARSGGFWQGQPVLGGLEVLRDLDRRAHVALAIGDNRARTAVGRAAQALSLTLATVVHPAARVSRGARVGPGTYIAAFALFQPDSEVGFGCIVGAGAVVSHDCRVGDWAHISPQAVLGGAAIVGEGVHIGMAAAVLPGLTIGAWSRVGAGGVATRSLPGDVTAVSVPAQVRTSASVRRAR